MGWFNDEDIGKLYKIILEDGQNIIGTIKKFDEVKVEVKLKDGRIKKFKDSKIEDVEEVNNSQELIKITEKFQLKSTKWNNIKRRKKRYKEKNLPTFKERKELFPYLQNNLRKNFSKCLEVIESHRKIIDPNIKSFLNIVKTINLEKHQVEKIYKLVGKEDEYNKMILKQFETYPDLIRYVQNNLKMNFKNTCDVIDKNKGLLQDKLIEFSNLVISINIPFHMRNRLENILSINFIEIQKTKESLESLNDLIENEKFYEAKNILENAYKKGHLPSSKFIIYLNVLFKLNENNKIIHILENEIRKTKNLNIKIKFIKQLSFYYSKMDEFKKALEIISNTLEDYKTDIDNEEKARLISQQILIKVKANDFKNIENYLNELEKIDPSNLMRQKVKDLKKDKINDFIDEIDNLIEKGIDYSTEFSNLDSFIVFYKESCTFSNISSTKRQNETYTKGDYKTLINIESVKSAEAKAERLLTAVRIAPHLNIDEKEINTKLVESLRFKANYYIQQEKFDIAKNYFLAILNQIEKTAKDEFYLKDILTNYLYAFLNKNFFGRKPDDENFIYCFKQLINISETKNLLINLRLFSKKSFDILYNILEKNSKLFLEYKEKYDLEGIKNSKNLYEKIELDLNTVAIKNIEDKIIIEILDKIDKYFLFNLDKKYFDDFKNIFIEFHKIFDSERFEEKELILEKCKMQLKNLLEIIEKEPTIFSINNLRDLIKIFLEKLETYSLELKKSSLPKITISTPMTTYIKIKNSFEFHLNISNEKNLSSANNINIEVYLKKDNVYTHKINKLSGGESKTLEIKLKAPKDIDTFSIKVKVKYENILQETENMEKDFSVSFEKEEDFKKIENPYFPDSDSVADKKMVYGRDELIERLSNMLYQQGVKGVILYGQKRSGKTTVFKYLQERMLERKDKFFTIFFSMGEVDSFQSFVRRITIRIKRDYKKQFNEKIFEYLDIEERSVNDLTSLFDFLEEVDEFLQKRNLKLLILIDEFTYLYGYMKNGKYSDSFLKNWKALIQRDLFKSALIGQNSMPLFINEYAPNEFQIYKKEPISYLDKQSAIKLIVNPIMIDGKSRYLEKSEELIYEYTNGSPYYIQKICDRLVEHLNEKKSKYITKAHIENVIELLFEKFTLEGDFDNLYSIGDGASEDIEDLRKDMILQIGIKSKNIGSVSFEDIKVDCNDNKKRKILQTLLDTNTINLTNNRYKINVKLFEKFIQENFNRN